MHHLLKQYHPYIVERHGKTLLPQYLAMFRLTVDNVEHYMVLMRNVFTGHLRVSSQLLLHRRSFCHIIKAKFYYIFYAHFILGGM